MQYIISSAQWEWHAKIVHFFKHKVEITKILAFVMPLLMISGLFTETFGKTRWILLSLSNKQSGNKDSYREGFLEGMVTPTEWSGNIINLYVNDNGLDFFK